MKKPSKLLPIILLVCVSLLCLKSTDIQSKDGSETKSNPAIQLLLLSEEEHVTPSQPNIAFVTSIAYTGNLGGLSGADQKCQDLAKAASLPDNTYRAWLSTSSVNAINRLGSARGWVRVDGKPFADTKADIPYKIYYPLRIDESGNDEKDLDSFVWTGTKSDGTLASDRCDDWTDSNVGLMGEVGANDGLSTIFTTSGIISCSNSYRLYCFGVDKKSQVTLKPTTGRVAFVTNSSWTPSSGLAGADQKCMDDAQQAGLPGSFKAFLAADGASAASRFNESGPQWVRPDGVAVALTAADLFEADFLDSAIHQSADGLLYLSGYGIWTGASSRTAAGTANTTCNNWTSSSEANMAIYGTAGYTSRIFFARTTRSCAATYFRLYCLQE